MYCKLARAWHDCVGLDLHACACLCVYVFYAFSYVCKSGLTCNTGLQAIGLECVLIYKYV